MSTPELPSFRPPLDAVRQLARDLDPIERPGPKARLNAKLKRLLAPTTAQRVRADAALGRLIERALDDVRRVIGDRAVLPTDLTADQCAAVQRSVCFQALYLLTTGGADELGFAGPSRTSASTTEGSTGSEGSPGTSRGSTSTIEFAQRSPRISPRVAELLALTGVIVRSGTVKPPPVEAPPAA